MKKGTLDSLLADLRNRLAEAEKKAQNLRSELDAALGYTEVECRGRYRQKGCGRRTPIRELVYIQTYWYVSPYSCSGGDYWNPGHGEFDCPHCGARNHLDHHPEVQKMQHLFLGVTDSYDR